MFLGDIRFFIFKVFTESFLKEGRCFSFWYMNVMIKGKKKNVGKEIIVFYFNFLIRKRGNVCC